LAEVSGVKRGSHMSGRFDRTAPVGHFGQVTGRCPQKVAGRRRLRRQITRCSGTQAQGDRQESRRPELWPAVVAETKRLRRARGKAGRLSCREITARLKDAGCCNERGQPFNLRSVGLVLPGSSPITIPSPSSKAHQKSGSFAPPALPGFNAPTTLSESRRGRRLKATLRPLPSPTTGLPL
jgi:hypothetical protein